MERDWSMSLYAPVRKPDIVFYFAGSAEVFANRIAASRQMKFYEAGQDITGLSDPFESYRRFAPKVLAQYQRLHEHFGFVIVNAEQAIYEQHRFIRETYMERTSSLSAKSVSHAPAHAFTPKLTQRTA